MKRIALLLSIIFYIPIDGMKRPCVYRNKRPVKKACIEQPSCYLPLDMWIVILEMCTYNKGKLDETYRTIKSLALMHPAIYAHYNTTHFINNLTERLCKRFFCPHENAIKNICPPIIKKQFRLQNKLKTMTLNIGSEEPDLQEYNIFNSTLNELIRTKANLDFTYNYKGEPNTLLMITYDQKNTTFFSLLLEKQRNFNNPTPQNKTLLMRITQFPIIKNLAEKVIANESVIIDQKNNRGETALLYCIKNRKNHTVTDAFLWTIKNLLLRGADPEIKDNEGKSPLDISRELKNTQPHMKDRAIQLIENAIAKKNQALQNS